MILNSFVRKILADMRTKHKIVLLIALAVVFLVFVGNLSIVFCKTPVCPAITPDFVSGVKPSYLIKIIREGTPEEKQQARDSLFNYLIKRYNPANYGMSFNRRLFFENICGDMQDECIAAFGLKGGRTSVVCIFKKNKNEYIESDFFKRSQIQNIEFEYLIDAKISALQLDELNWGSGFQDYTRTLLKWDQNKMRTIWSGTLKKSSFIFPEDYRTEETADISYQDIDNNGIKEIIREGSVKTFAFDKDKKKWGTLAKSEHKFRQVYKWEPNSFKYKRLSD